MIPASLGESMRFRVLAAILAVPFAWLWAVALVGRAMPWSASRWLALTFLVAFAILGHLWYRFLWTSRKLAYDAGQRSAAGLVGTGPALVASAAILALIYSSDSFNASLEIPYGRLPLVAGVALITFAQISLQSAILHSISARGALHLRATLAELGCQAEPVVIVTLLLLGALQTTVGISPVGDDIWHYTEVADALLEGRSYPIATISPMLQAAGMAAAYPALPFFPILIAVSFVLFGRTTFGVAIPNVVTTALFPLIFYLACRAVTKSRLAAFIATVLLYLFPIYQMNTLGAPQPDTVFITLLLIAALFAARVERNGRIRDWLGMGVFLGLVCLTRHEGPAYAAALFGTFFLVHRLKRGFLLAVTSCLAVMAPFVIFFYSYTGTPWPRTFGGSIMGLEHLQGNLDTLSVHSLGWFAQAIGVTEPGMILLFIVTAIAVLVGTIALGLRSPALAGIPLAGAGNIAAGFFMHPMVVYSPYPVEFLRHISYGIPFCAIGLAYAGYTGYKALAKMGRKTSLATLCIVAILTTGILVYEIDRMAKPTYYYGGSADLLWTGSGYLLTDLYQNPVKLPKFGDPRPGEEIREAMTAPIENRNLRKVNLSEPFEWASLYLAVFGLTYCAVRAVANHISD